MPWMPTHGVVVDHPGVQRGLGRFQRREHAVGEELAAYGLVEPLDLAGGGGRMRRGQQVTDAVIVTDAVERTAPVRCPDRNGRTTPWALSVKICSGTPWRRVASVNASHTARDVAWATTLASTQKREWSSIQ